MGKARSRNPCRPNHQDNKCVAWVAWEWGEVVCGDRSLKDALINVLYLYLFNYAGSKGLYAAYRSAVSSGSYIIFLAIRWPPLNTTGHRWTLQATTEHYRPARYWPPLHSGQHCTGHHCTGQQCTGQHCTALHSTGQHCNTEPPSQAITVLANTALLTPHITGQLCTGQQCMIQRMQVVTAHSGRPEWMAFTYACICAYIGTYSIV